MNLRPLKDNVLIQWDEPKNKIGSIHLPDQFAKRANIGEVKAIGNEVNNVKVGDRVLFDDQKVKSAKQDDGDGAVLLLTKDEDILAVVVEEEA